jgi:3-hydroxyacyl-[acyl-carrier-protein] dehydratase
MVPALLFDLAGIDLDQVQYDTAAIERVNPHRGAMRLIDGVIYMSPDLTRAVAYKDVRADEFWVPGHIPGRPLFPGVLMVEAGAQVASFVTLCRFKEVKFLGFAGVDGVKFRGQVAPGDRLLLLGIETECRPRRVTCKIQGLVRGTMVFEATITGMPM